MTSPFAFVPRIVAEHAKPWNGISRTSSSPEPTTGDDGDDIEDDDQLIKSNREAHPRQSSIPPDIAALISLALSDYNIWRDSDLRWKLDACLSDDILPGDAGFVPINYLLRRAPVRGSLGQLEPSETEAVKALRTHASNTLEVRMRLPSVSSSSSVWYGTGKTSRKKDVGGYEVRRRDWSTLRDHPSRAWPRARWDDITAYIEGIPPQYRTVGGIARFTEMLCSSSSAMDTELRTLVQNVTLPPHYLDKPGDNTKCKGYALVTFSVKSRLETVLRAWPWKRPRLLVPSNEEKDASISFVVKEAHKYGLRAISKARWDALNEEYLLYKQRLVDELARTQSEMHHPVEVVTESELEFSERTSQVQSTSPYPFDCLVFVRNVHPETNRTTLKALFGQAFQDDGQGDRGQAPVGLDYVDFTKGMNSCYLRLTSPQHTMRLITYMDERRKAQANGLDATGRAPIQGDDPITVELIQGKREALYWEQVPEKVRRQAVARAVDVQRASASIACELPESLQTTVIPMPWDDTQKCGRRKKRVKMMS